MKLTWAQLVAILMAILTFLLRRKKTVSPPVISLIVPFRADYPERAMNWVWLRSYYEHALPEAEIIVGTNDEVPFRKTAAVNSAFKRAKGDVIVILDADCYIDVEAIRNCANQIREARANKRKLWFIPYRRFYRLSEVASQALLATDPISPMHFTDPPQPWQLDQQGGISFGHWYGALISILPREAFVAAGGMDLAFQGWGGEDVSFLYAVDTMYGRHKSLDGPVYHIWHPTIKGAWAMTRQWKGQPSPEMNDHLSSRYESAVGDKALMRDLINRRDE